MSFHPASTSQGKFWPSSLLNGTLSRGVLLALYNAIARTSPSHFGSCRLSWLAGEHCKVAKESEAARGVEGGYGGGNASRTYHLHYPCCMSSLGCWFFEDIWVLVQTCTVAEMEVVEVVEAVGVSYGDRR